jgi:hypothetical protein
MDGLNAAVREALPGSDLYLATSPIFFAEGWPAGRYFVEDGLHLTADAYSSLAAYALPHVKTGWMQANHRSHTRINAHHHLLFYDITYIFRNLLLDKAANHIILLRRITT